MLVISACFFWRIACEAQRGLDRGQTRLFDQQIDISVVTSTGDLKPPRAVRGALQQHRPISGLPENLRETIQFPAHGMLVRIGNPAGGGELCQ